MKKIAIITATDQEIRAIKNKFKNAKEELLNNLVLYTGKLNNKEYILVKCGIGKVNAARTAQMLIDKFDIEHIINIGAAGSLNDSLEIGDMVIGEELVQHDFDTTAFGDDRGYITGVGKFFKSNDRLIRKYKEYAEKNIQDYNVKVGIIASGDIFCTKKTMKDKIRAEFGADCVEMEGAAIAQICTLNMVPFIVIRAISDKPNGENHMDYNQFADMASERCADMICNCEE